jgi:hypothetical protein
MVNGIQISPRSRAAPFRSSNEAAQDVEFGRCQLHLHSIFTAVPHNLALGIDRRFRNEDRGRQRRQQERVE